MKVLKRKDHKKLVWLLKLALSIYVLFLVFSGEQFRFTYRHMTMGSVFELLVSALCTLFMGLALCYGILKWEKLFLAFRKAEKKEGFLLALYFSVSVALLHNPLETAKNEVTSFSRVIGQGLVSNVDVSKRIHNFQQWMILFAAAFVLFYLLANSLFQQERGEDGKKAAGFLKNDMVLANCCLLLRCITYFSDATAATAVFYFSSYAVMLVALIVVFYLVLELEKKVSLKNYARMHFAAGAASLPLAVFFAPEWGKGRVFLGIWFLAAFVIILYCKLGMDFNKQKKIEALLEAVSLMAALLPLLLSIYIELIHVLNQYQVFVAHPAKYYKIAMAVFALVTVLSCVFVKKNSYDLDRLWKWSVPVFVFGVACLSVQIPISSTYSPDLFEGANYSILISDFLNFGTVPIVEHYGGHMMTSVWEGILYGVVNRDYAGAVVSPYASMLLPFLAVLFYVLVKEIWDEKMAAFVSLLFPFYGFWSYYGLGMLVCIAAVSYIRKNSYGRAALLWLAFIWCAIYRLDLGFAFGMALAFSMMTYVVATKNWRALKELGITLAAWIIAGGCLWCAICLAKGVNPVYRLMEFLLINLSNQNWAYAEIGNTGNTLFWWSYILIPFLVVLCLLYTTFVKPMRDKIGLARWMILLIMGWAYVQNFSRGLVRHSLAETATTVVIWSGYLFLAMFWSAYKDHSRLFLPVFMVLILCNTLFVQDGNFTSVSIAENAVRIPEPMIESWEPAQFSQEMTYWEKVKYDQETVNRVELDQNLIRYVNKYRGLLEALLEEDETFVDFMNKTLLFSLLGKENPVYVSQSPLQLSGEFTQEAYIKEIAGVPLVLMPVDTDNYRASNALDGITNLYRYYKVAEYIFQNYTPLCQYAGDYAVWCRKDRLDAYKEKTAQYRNERNYIGELAQNTSIGRSNAEMMQKEEGTVVIKPAGADPMVTELQNLFDLSAFIGTDMQICVDYTTDIEGAMQLFYTTDPGEDYTGDKVVTEMIAGSGTVSFTIPVTEASRIRMDTPEGSTVEIKSLITANPVKIITYGYDGPNAVTDASNAVSYSYISALHNHSISQLPRIWAKADQKKAIHNTVVAEAAFSSGVFSFDPEGIDKSNGNYCCISASYDGMDSAGLYKNDDEQAAATIIMGKDSNGVFEEKCRYHISLKEGTHDYLIRCSTDYYWYLNEINAIKIQADGEIYPISVKILEGD